MHTTHTHTTASISLCHFDNKPPGRHSEDARQGCLNLGGGGEPEDPLDFGCTGTRIKKKNKTPPLVPDHHLPEAGAGLKRRSEVSPFQVIHEALSKFDPMIYHADVLAEP